MLVVKAIEGYDLLKENAELRKMANTWASEETWEIDLRN